VFITGALGFIGLRLARRARVGTRLCATWLKTQGLLQ
jgi:nucleoside-diphosphate-sugar epimerase